MSSKKINVMEIETIKTRSANVFTDLENIFLLLGPSPFHKCLYLVSSIVITFLPDYVICVLRKKGERDLLGEVIASNAIKDIYGVYDELAQKALKLNREKKAITPISVEELTQDKFGETGELRSKAHWGVKFIETLTVVPFKDGVIELILPYEEDAVVEITDSIKVLENLPWANEFKFEKVEPKKEFISIEPGYLISAFKEFYDLHESYLQKRILEMEKELGVSFVYTTPCFMNPCRDINGCGLKKDCNIPLCHESGYFKNQGKVFMYYLPEDKKETVKAWLLTKREDLSEEDDEWKKFKEHFVQGNKEGAAVTTLETFVPEFVNVNNDPRINAYKAKLEEFESRLGNSPEDEKFRKFVEVRRMTEKKFLGERKYLSAFPLLIENTYFGMVLVPLKEKEMDYEINWRLFRITSGSFSRILEPLLIEWIEKITKDYLASPDLENFEKTHERVIKREQKNYPYLLTSEIIKRFSNNLYDKTTYLLKKIKGSVTAEEIGYCVMRGLAHFEKDHVLNRDSIEFAAKNDEIARKIEEIALQPVRNLFEIYRDVLVEKDWYEEEERYNIFDYLQELAEDNFIYYTTGWWNLQESIPKNKVKITHRGNNLEVCVKKSFIRWIYINLLRNTTKHAAAKKEGTIIGPAHNIQIELSQENNKWIKIEYHDDAHWESNTLEERKKEMRKWIETPRRRDDGTLDPDSRGYAIRVINLLLKRISKNKEPPFEIDLKNNYLYQRLWVPIT